MPHSSMPFPRASRAHLAVGALLSFAFVSPALAASSDLALAGQCASFVKRIDAEGSKSGIARSDLYEGLSGWLAMKAGLSTEQVRASAQRANENVAACPSFGLAAEPLLALEAIVANVPAARVRPAVEACLAALKVIEDSAAGPGREAARAASTNQARILGKLLAYLAKDKKPAPGAVEAQAEMLRKEAAGDLRSNPAFGSALSACGPLGMDVALLARIRSSL